ncbi:MAG: histidinol dehydrogenase [Bacteroidales bacterium]
MKVYNKPEREQWTDLIRRPVIDKKSISETVEKIVKTVQQEGDAAIVRYTKEFDGAAPESIAVPEREIQEADALLSPELKDALNSAYMNIYAFHNAQREQEQIVETAPGVKCWRKSVAIEKVGLYIPGGSAPLFSTVLMLGIPAQIAGCREIVLCTPPGRNGKIHPAILYTACKTGITKIFKTGGAQAIAAMAYGTETIPMVDKIFGPGNQYVTKAKERVQQDGVAIDIPAGPSEALVIADKTCNPAFVAADLLSQAEHGPDSQVILLCDNLPLLEQCLREVEKQLENLPRQAIALKALAASKAIVLGSLDECLDFSNAYAPEHLIIASEKARGCIPKIVNAGSVFLGNYSCESAGDYASGTNHTLPTNGYARSYSGVSLDSFVKKITFQELSREGLETIGKTVQMMARAEELDAHANAVTIRIKTENND